MNTRRRSAVLRAVTLTTIAAATAGCGTPEPGTDAAPVGVYQGLPDAGTSDLALVVDHRDVWAFYGTHEHGRLRVKGFARGQGVNATGGLRSADLTDFGATPPQTGSMGARYDAHTGTLSGTRHHSDRWIDFSGRLLRPAGQGGPGAAQLPALAGAWTLDVASGEAMQLSIAPDGQVSGHTSLRCRFTGAVRTVPAQRHVLHLSLRFGGAPCVMAGETVTGIGLVLPLRGGSQQLIVGGANARGTMGIAASGTRS